MPTVLCHTHLPPRQPHNLSPRGYGSQKPRLGRTQLSPDVARASSLMTLPDPRSGTERGYENKPSTSLQTSEPGRAGQTFDQRLPSPASQSLREPPTVSPTAEQAGPEPGRGDALTAGYSYLTVTLHLKGLERSGPLKTRWVGSCNLKTESVNRWIRTRLHRVNSSTR